MRGLRNTGGRLGRSLTEKGYLGPSWAGVSREQTCRLTQELFTVRTLVKGRRCYRMRGLMERRDCGSPWKSHDPFDKGVPFDKGAV